MADRFEHPNQMIRPHGKHDRKVKLQDLVHFSFRKLHDPVYQKLLPRDGRRVEQTNYSGLHRGGRHAGCPSFEGFAFYLRFAAGQPEPRLRG